jgi:hypothetical protein
VGFSPPLYTDTTVYAGIDKAFTVSANEPTIFDRQPNLGAHGDSSGDLSVALRQPRLFTDGFLRQAKKDVDAFHGNAFGLVHSGKSTP